MQQKTLETVLAMSQQLASMKRKQNYEAQKVVQKEKELQMKFTQQEEEGKLQVQQLLSRIDLLIAEQSLVKKNYESQIRMLSEHIIELSG